MCLNNIQLDAVSNRAASYISSGIDCIAASTITNTNGVHCHASTVNTAVRAAQGSVNQRNPPLQVLESYY